MVFSVWQVIKSMACVCSCVNTAIRILPERDLVEFMK